MEKKKWGLRLYENFNEENENKIYTQPWFLCYKNIQYFYIMKKNSNNINKKKLIWKK